MWQIISWSFISLLIIIAVRKFQRCSNLMFVVARKPIFILKLDQTAKCNFRNTKRPLWQQIFPYNQPTMSLRVIQMSEEKEM